MNVVVIVIITICLLNFKKMVPAFFFFFLNEKVGRIFLCTLAVFPNQASSICKRPLWLASSPSFSLSSSVYSVGLASKQTEKSKEKRPGNQRGDYSQMT